MNRRRFLQAGIGLAVFGPARLLADNAAEQRLLSCYSDHQDRNYLGMTDLKGRLLMNIRLPARGHGITVDQRQQLAAVFARRPGEYVWIINLQTQNVVQKISASEGRHFYGHGVFNAQGQLLCSENAYESGDGRIGVYDTSAGFSRLGEYPSGGIGPHEIRLLGDDRTLVVANGGIRTHPDLPRVKSNISSMRPNLAYVDGKTGRLLHKHEPPAQWQQLSIRHISVSDNDTVAIAMQYEGLPYKQPPLIALQQGTQKLKMLKAPPGVQKRLKNYCGSVEFSNDGSRFAVSSPRGGLVTYWSDTGEFLGFHNQQDVCGLAPITQVPEGFIASDGAGDMKQIDVKLNPGNVSAAEQRRWDNHMLSFSAMT